jgi:peroxiredoxin Q/BCP
MSVTPAGMPAEGSPAPDFALADKDGTTHTLQSFNGRWLVLYFYPRANTPGCTREGKDFTDLLPRFEALGCTVAGVRALCGPHFSSTRQAYCAAYGRP